jgi:hypothetical protein
MRYRLVIALVSAILIIGVGAFRIFYPTIGRNICEARDGKWAGTYNSCITRSCYNEHTCGEWASPVVWCDRLGLNAPIAEVYFQLGEPDHIEGGQYLWHREKGGPGFIVATFTNEKLSSLKCDP